jgi:hypothetical protein
MIGYFFIWNRFKSTKKTLIHLMLVNKVNITWNIALWAITTSHRKITYDICFWTWFLQLSKKQKLVLFSP